MNNKPKINRYKDVRVFRKKVLGEDNESMILRIISEMRESKLFTNKNSYNFQVFDNGIKQWLRTVFFDEDTMDLFEMLIHGDKNLLEELIQKFKGD